MNGNIWEIISSVFVYVCMHVLYGVCLCVYRNVNTYTPWQICGSELTTLGNDTHLPPSLKQGLLFTTVEDRPAGPRTSGLFLSPPPISL